MTTKKKAKAKPKRTKNATAIDALYKAVQGYVEANGGSLVVIGGISVQEWPQDGSMCFHVAVKCLGRKPELGQSSTSSDK